ncbi:MAG: zinc-dependent metalloprotease [Flavobacteriales bacterium]|nr:zinc-dependent metalloprotease [Flavobacteriales bacterium]
MIRNLILLATACISLLAHGQAAQRDCAAHAITEQYLAQQGLSTDLLAALPHVNGRFRGGSYTVPVVVHVVYNTAAENVSDAAIMAMVNQMNQDYSETNSDVGTVRPAFSGVVANVGFNFCLAQIDPSGNATTGITRTQTSQTWFDPDSETNLMKEAQYGKTPWNTNQYLNIWVCDITSGAAGGFITVGYAYLPVGGVVGSGIDGLVIDYNYGLNAGDRTATHEIGHYFGLQHTFDDDGSCNNTDGFTDTPNTNSPTYSCSNTTLMKCGVLTQYENFMDYSNCSVMFTDQQANYMAGVLTGVRSGLLNNSACGSTSGYCIPTAATGTSDGDFINSVQLVTINNLNSGGTTAPAYTNFSASHSTDLTQGTQYTLTVQGGTYQPDHYTAWIDYDQDETFETSEKMTEVTSSAANQTMTFTFTVPASATLGGTRMRVRGVFHNTGEPTPNTDPCFAYAYGETEDYGITIQSATATGYCIPTSTSGTTDGDFINSVQLGSINNVNSGASAAPFYYDLSATHNTTLVLGSQYTLTVQGGTYQPDHFTAWIDFDQDETYEVSEKMSEIVSSAADQIMTFVFTVPANATIGATRMRVRGVFHDTGEPTPNTDPCYAYTYGETEDYGIVIDVNTGVNGFDPRSLQVFPNPAGSTVQLILPSDQFAFVELVDMQGRTVATFTSDTSVRTLDLLGISDGTYVLRILQGETVMTRSLVLNSGAH